MGSLLGQTNPDSILLILLGRTESYEDHHHEDQDDQNLDIGEVVQRLEQS